MTPLAGWENFYVIVGSSAGALIGLQFVVITLIADIPITRVNAQAGSAFGAPTVFHLVVLFLLIQTHRNLLAAFTPCSLPPGKGAS